MGINRLGSKTEPQPQPDHPLVDPIAAAVGVVVIDEKPPRFLTLPSGFNCSCDTFRPVPLGLATCEVLVRLKTSARTCSLMCGPTLNWRCTLKSKSTTTRTDLADDPHVHHFVGHLVAVRRGFADAPAGQAYNPPMTLILVLVILAAIAVAVIAIYNGLVRLNVQTNNAWADIDVQLKRRHDLIPNVVETVKGYASHERQTLEAVINARNRAVSVQGSGPAERGQAEGALAGALRGLFALAESYPQLRAAENFGQLQSTLAQIEDAVQNARRYYNAVVRDLNTRIQQFPSNIIAGMFGFKTREFFEVPDTEKAVPQVKF